MNNKLKPATVQVIGPDGKLYRATYRSRSSSAAWIRVNGFTVSGRVQPGIPPTFKPNPNGINAFLVN